MPGTILAVDVGGTKTAALVYDADSGEAIHRARIQTDRSVSPEAWVRALPGRVDRWLGACSRSRSDLRAIGFAVPGRVDDDGNVLHAGNLAGWTDVPLRSLVQCQLCVDVSVEQDANAAAIGERWKGAATHMSEFVFIALGTGVGAGIVSGGRLLRGKNHSAGELGDLIVSSESLRLRHPHEESLGVEVSGPRLRKEAAALHGAPVHAADVVRADDPRLEPLADRVANDVGVAVIATVALLDPEAVILGGGTASPELADRVRSHVQRALSRAPVILVSALGEDAQLYGAIKGAIAAMEEP